MIFVKRQEEMKGFSTFSPCIIWLIFYSYCTVLTFNSVFELRFFGVES